jgi:hypothetical protein
LLVFRGLCLLGCLCSLFCLGLGLFGCSIVQSNTYLG